MDRRNMSLSIALCQALPLPSERYIICFSIKLFLMRWIIAFFPQHKGSFLYDVVT